MYYSLGIGIYIDPNNKYTVNHRLRLLLEIYDDRDCDQVLNKKK